MKSEPIDQYEDTQFQADFQTGFKDGLAGKLNSRHARFARAPYMSGYDEGFKERQHAINQKRVELLVKAREAKKVGFRET